MNQDVKSLPLDHINLYRAETFNTLPDRTLKSADEAIAYVNQRGFIFFWPIKEFPFPSLWEATTGNRFVPDEHDDPGHVTWHWKDSLLGKHVWFYSRILLGKNTLISLETLPYFYALSPNYGEPESDYLLEYEQGHLTMEAKAIYEALLEKGPLDTLHLRKAARLSSPENTSRFTRALNDLQKNFRVLPTGISDSGAWHYSFIYDLVHRHYPGLIDQCRYITDETARTFLLKHYMLSLGGSSLSEIRKLFGWKLNDCQKTLNLLLNEHFITQPVTIEQTPGTTMFNKSISSQYENWCVLSKFFPEL